MNFGLFPVWLESITCILIASLAIIGLHMGFQARQKSATGKVSLLRISLVSIFILSVSELFGVVSFAFDSFRLVSESWTQPNLEDVRIASTKTQPSFEIESRESIPSSESASQIEKEPQTLPLEPTHFFKPNHEAFVLPDESLTAEAHGTYLDPKSSSPSTELTSKSNLDAGEEIPASIPEEITEVAILNSPSPSNESSSNLIPKSMVPFYLALLWLGGSMVLGLKFLWGQIGLMRFKSKLNKLHDPQIESALDQICSRLQSSIRPQLFSSPKISMPLTFGLFTPSLVFPQEFKRHCSSKELDVILAHEMAHLVHSDPFWIRVSELFCILFWWNPAIWWIDYKLRQEHEFAADEASLNLDEGPLTLAECLVRFGSKLHPQANAHLLSADGGEFRSALGRRVSRLLEPSTVTWKSSQKAHRWTHRVAFFLVLVTLATLPTVLARTTPTSPGDDTMKSLDITRRWRNSFAALMLVSVWTTAQQLDAQDDTDFPEEISVESNEGLDDPSSDSGEDSTDITNIVKSINETADSPEDPPASLDDLGGDISSDSDDSETGISSPESKKRARNKKNRNSRNRRGSTARQGSFSEDKPPVKRTVGFEDTDPNPSSSNFLAGSRSTSRFSSGASSFNPQGSLSLDLVQLASALSSAKMKSELAEFKFHTAAAKSSRGLSAREATNIAKIEMESAKREFDMLKRMVQVAYNTNQRVLSRLNRQSETLKANHKKGFTSFEALNRHEMILDIYIGNQELLKTLLSLDSQSNSSRRKTSLPAWRYGPNELQPTWSRELEKSGKRSFNERATQYPPEGGFSEGIVDEEDPPEGGAPIQPTFKNSTVRQLSHTNSGRTQHHEFAVKLDSKAKTRKQTLEFLKNMLIQNKKKFPKATHTYGINLIIDEGTPMKTVIETFGEISKLGLTNIKFIEKKKKVKKATEGLKLDPRITD